MQPFQYDLRSSAAKDNSITHAAAAPSNLDAAIPMRSADWVAKHKRTMRNGVGNCSSKTGWISTPKQKKDDFEALFKRIFKRKITCAKVEKICWQITIAAWMQPFQYDLRCSAAKGNSITHTATLHGKTQGFVLRLPPQNIAHATFMQPLQCNLQPEIQEPNRTMHTDTTTRCKTHRRNNSRTKRPQPHPPHRRGTFHRRLQPLYTEKNKVSCSGFLPKT